MYLGDKITSWVVKHPILSICFMAAAELCAVVWVVSVYLAG